MTGHAEHWLDKLRSDEEIPSEYKLLRSRTMCIEIEADGFQTLPDRAEPGT